MEQTDSIRGELQTLIALEQQQAETLSAIHSRGAFNPTPMQVGGFGYGQSHYMPGMAGFQKIPALGNYVNQVSGALNYAQNSLPFMPAINNLSSGIRNAMVSQNLDSTGFFSANQSKMSSEAREMMGANLGAKFSTGTLSAVSMLSGYAGQGIGSLLGKGLLGSSLAGSLLFGTGVGAVVGGTVDIAADQVKQNYAYDRYLLQNSNKFIDVFESNNDRNVGGFSRKERWDMSNWLRHFNTDYNITDSDTMTLLKGFTEGDLLREVSNADNFKEKMKQLADAAKSIALSFNASIEEAVQVMADLKKKGIDQRDYKNIAATSKVIGGLTGQDAMEVQEDTTNLTYSIAQRYGNAELDPDKVLKTAQGATAYLGRMYEDGDEYTRNLVTNMGGSTAAAAATTDVIYRLLGENDTNFSMYSAAFTDWDEKEGKLIFNRDEYEKFIKSDMSLEELADIGIGKLQSFGLQATQYWQEHQAAIMQNAFLGISDQTEYINAILNAAERTAGFEGTTKSFKIEALLRDLDLSGAEKNLLATVLNYTEADGGKLESQISAAGVAQAMVDDYQADHPGAFYSAKNQWGKVKDTIGDVGDAITTPVRLAGRAFSDWWMGKPVEDMRQLWIETDWTKNPFDDLAESMEGYQEALYNSGVRGDRLAAANPALFGSDHSGSIGERGVYGSIDALTKAIEGLTGDTKKLAETIEKASRDGGVSENTAAALVKSLGITDSAKASEVINMLSEKVKGGMSEAEALKDVLSSVENGITNPAEQDKIIEQFNVSDDKNNAVGNGMRSQQFLKQTFVDNVDRGALSASERMLLSDNSIAVSAISIDERIGVKPFIYGSGAHALYLNEMLGLNYGSEKKVGDTSDYLGVTNNPEMSEKEGIKKVADILYDGGLVEGLWDAGSDLVAAFEDNHKFKKQGFTEEDLINMDTAYAGPLRDAARLIKEFDENGENSKWAGLSQEERYNNLALLVQGYGYYKDRGMLNEEFVSDIFNGIDIDNLKSGGAETIKKYMFVGEAEEKFYDGQKTWNDMADWLIDAQNGGNEEMFGSIDIGGKTMEEAREYLESELAALDEEYKGARNHLLAKEGDLDSYIKKQGLEEHGLLEMLKDGNISDLNGYSGFMSEKGLSEDNNLKNLVNDYLGAKSKLEPYETQKKYLKQGIGAAADKETKMLTYRTGFVSLGRALGFSDDDIDRIEGELSDAFSNGDKKTINQLNESVEKTRKFVGNRLFDGYMGQTVDEYNAGAIQQNVAARLMATGAITENDAKSMAESFITSGTELTSNTVGEFVNTVLGSITFGENSEETKLKQAMDANTKAVEENTEAVLTGGGFGQWLYDRFGNKTKTKDLSDTDITNYPSSDNNNGTSPATTRTISASMGGR